MKNMKKVLGLVLVIALAVVLCVSCAKKAEEETAAITVRLVNAAGMDITKITLKDRIGSEKQEWMIESLSDGNEVAMTIRPAVKNGAPEMDFFYNTADTQQGTIIVEKATRRSPSSLMPMETSSLKSRASNQSKTQTELSLQLPIHPDGQLFPENTNAANLQMAGRPGTHCSKTGLYESAFYMQITHTGFELISIELSCL